jgi:hypothetical protein
VLFGLDPKEFFWLMYILDFVLETFLLYRYGPIGSEESITQFTDQANMTPEHLLRAAIFIALLISSLMWVVSLPYIIYKILKYGLPEPRDYE